MRIAFLCDPESPNGWYRAIGPMIALGRRGHQIRQAELMRGVVRPELVRGCDVVHIHRRHDEEVQKIIRYAKEAGIAVVWDNDDDETAVPKGHPSYRDYGGIAGERVKTAVRRMVQAADLVTTPSPVLAERFRELGAAHVQLIENYVRDELHDARAAPRAAEVVIGWLAGGEHKLDIDRVPIADALHRLLDAHANVRVVSLGAAMGIDHERYRVDKGIPFFDLPPRLTEWDIGLAVIADIPFNRARSNVKLKEYAALGLPWLASPIGPYAGMGEQQGGRLVPDDGWYAALERLVLKPRERRKLAKRAAKWGREQTIGANAAVWEKALEGAVARAAGARG
jgi:glycosyltransferase involved in cell wall biosynthesis